MLRLRLLNNRLAEARLTALCFLCSKYSLALFSKYSLFYLATSSIYLLRSEFSISCFAFRYFSSSNLIREASDRLNFFIIVSLKYWSKAFYISNNFFFILEFQWFLMVLSVLPSKTLAISAHLLPFPRCIKYKIHSSSLLQQIFLIFGLRWLCHLSLHYFPILPGKCSAITVHFWGPFFSTRWSTILSSSSVHGPLIKLGFKTFYHLWRHCTSVLPGNSSAIFFQFFPLCFFTASES